jgi:hypothetical protein
MSAAASTRSGNALLVPALAFVGLLAAACSPDPFAASRDPTGAKLRGMSISGNNIVRVGSMIGVEAYVPFGSLHLPLSEAQLADIQWSSADPSVATVGPDQPGSTPSGANTVVNGIAPGSTYIVVRSQGQGGRLLVHVVIPFP